jgi:hypothetical protein
MGDLMTSNPATSICPALGRSKVVMAFMVVDFPAPLGPRKATISPFLSSKEIWFTARCSP